MAKDKTITTGFFHELFQLTVYKRSQGRIARQVTLAAIWVVVALGVYRLNETLMGKFTDLNTNARYAICGTLLLAGLALGFRLVNFSKFADFLISVEAEMNKVSWPSRAELVRSSMVVIIVMFSMAFMLWFYDIIWVTVFQWLGLRQ